MYQLTVTTDNDTPMTTKFQAKQSLYATLKSGGKWYLFWFPNPLAPGDPDTRQLENLTSGPRNFIPLNLLGEFLIQPIMCRN